MKTLVVGLVSGPGAGKSTLAAGLFADLKTAGVNCELASEWIKEAVWEGRDAVAQCQPMVWGQQLWRIQRLLGKVDVVITDSPPILGSLYTDCPMLKAAMWSAHEATDGVNLLVRVRRTKPYNPAGRWQDADAAAEFDDKAGWAIPCALATTGDVAGRSWLVGKILERMSR